MVCEDVLVRWSAVKGFRMLGATSSDCANWPFGTVEFSFRDEDVTPIVRHENRAGNRYFFSSDLIFLSNSSKAIAPLIFSPLMKKVGVTSTLSFSNAKV